MQNNWVNILIFLLVIGGPILGRVLQWLSEQKKAKDRERRLETARLEALRTGRSVEEVLGVPSAPQQQASETGRMQELARKRQEQLQELRRRQQAARQPQAQRPGTPQPRLGQTRTLPAPNQPPPRPAGVVRPPQQAPARSAPTQARNPAQLGRPTQVGRPTQTGRPAQVGRPTQVGRPAQISRAGQAAARRAPPLPEQLRATRPQVPSSAAPPKQERLSETAASRPIEPHTGAPTGGAPVVALLGQPMSPADWRRFIVAREILDPPLALREDGPAFPPT